MNKLFEDYKNLSIQEKRDILLSEIQDTLKVIEKICKQKKISIETLNSKKYIKDKDKLLDENYYELFFIYITYIKEDLAKLL